MVLVTFPSIPVDWMDGNGIIGLGVKVESRR